MDWRMRAEETLASAREIAGFGGATGRGAPALGTGEAEAASEAKARNRSARQPRRRRWLSIPVFGFTRAWSHMRSTLTPRGLASKTSPKADAQQGFRQRHPVPHDGI